MPTFRSKLDGFVQWLELEGRSPVTQSNYKRDVEECVKFLESRGHGEIGVIPIDELDAYKASLLQRIGVNTLRARVAAVRTFGSWLQSRGHFPVNPFERLSPPRNSGRRGLPRPPKAEDVIAMLKAEQRTIFQRRNHVILLLMALGGLRRVEVHRLNIEDVDFENDALYIQGKGGKERFVPIHPIVMAQVEKYIERVRPLFLRGVPGARFGGHLSIGPLFLGRGGKRITNEMVWNAIRERAETAGVPHVKPHALRHGCATRVLRASGNLAVVQDLLGHASPETTRVYTRIASVDMRAAVGLDPVLAEMEEIWKKEKQEPTR